jgi:hypothetical protein
MPAGPRNASMVAFLPCYASKATLLRSQGRSQLAARRRWLITVVIPSPRMLTP